MKTIRWHDGQKLRPDDLKYQNIFIEQSLIELFQSITGNVSILDLQIDLEYLYAGIFKVINFTGMFGKQFIIYPYLNKQDFIYELNQINLKEEKSSDVTIFLNLETEIVSSQYHIADVPMSIPKIRLSTVKESGKSLKLCCLKKDVSARWHISSSYIPNVPVFKGFTKLLLNISLSQFIKNMSSYIKEQKHLMANSVDIFLLLQAEAEFDKLLFILSDSYQQQIAQNNIVESLVLIYSLFSKYHQNKNRSFLSFKITAADTITSTIECFKKSLTSMMIESKNDEKIDFLSEGDTFCAKIDFTEYQNTKNKYYLFIRKPNSNFSYNSKTLRLSSPNRIPILRGLNIPGIRLIHKNHNPTSIIVEQEFYDIFELAMSREFDYVVAEGYIAYDKITLDPEIRMFLVKSYQHESQPND